METNLTHFITLWLCWHGCLQCFDAVGWAAEGHSACKILSDGMLDQSADLHMAQLMPLPLTISCSS